MGARPSSHQPRREVPVEVRGPFWAGFKRSAWRSRRSVHSGFRYHGLVTSASPEPADATLLMTQAAAMIEPPLSTPGSGPDTPSQK